MFTPNRTEALTRKLKERLMDLQTKLAQSEANRVYCEARIKELSNTVAILQSRLLLADATIEGLRIRLGCDEPTDVTTPAEERELVG